MLLSMLLLLPMLLAAHEAAHVNSAAIHVGGHADASCHIGAHVAHVSNTHHAAAAAHVGIAHAAAHVGSVLVAHVGIAHAAAHVGSADVAAHSGIQAAAAQLALWLLYEPSQPPVQAAFSSRGYSSLSIVLHCYP